jgi:polyadenylate-binding protein
MKDINPDCNVFIKNLDESITTKDVDTYFSKFGQIFSSKVVLGDNGESRGYGYI